MVSTYSRSCSNRQGEAKQDYPNYDVTPFRTPDVSKFAHSYRFLYALWRDLVSDITVGIVWGVIVLCMEFPYALWRDLVSDGFEVVNPYNEFVSIRLMA